MVGAMLGLTSGKANNADTQCTPPECLLGGIQPQRIITSHLS